LEKSFARLGANAGEGARAPSISLSLPATSLLGKAAKELLPLSPGPRAQWRYSAFDFPLTQFHRWRVFANEISLELISCHDSHGSAYWEGRETLDCAMNSGARHESQHR